MEHLLSDEQIRQFIVNGFISIKANVPDPVHEIIFERSKKIMGNKDGSWNPGNNIVPKCPKFMKSSQRPKSTVHSQACSAEITSSTRIATAM